MAKKDDSAEMFIYDGIGLFGVEAESFINEINAMDVNQITLRINSPGGNVFDGTAIYNALRRHKAKVDVKIDGLAASMASIIALAGDTVEMADNAFFMIHMPWSLVVGDSEDMRKEADVLDQLAGAAVKTYANRSGMSEADVRSAMKEETWYSAEQAKDAGFVDTIYSGDNEEMRFDLTVFAKAPEGISAPSEHKPTERGLEAILRDAGMSKKEAAEYISAFKLERRDAGSGSQRDAEFDCEVARLVEKRGILTT
jgi:ATP-dependent Clp endopeptidase proteolytic subunit ClpP